MAAFLVLLVSCARPPELPTVVEEPVIEEPVVEEEVPILQPVTWQEVPGWREDDPSLAMGAFLNSCTALRWRAEWQSPCQQVAVMEHATAGEMRQFFERNFVPHQVRQSDGSAEGLMTGYYVPDRGRLDGHRVIPYWDRGGIDSYERPLAGQELFWVADPVELFFLHIQGSGRILLDNGESVMVTYADQNGHPYRSIGKYLLDRGLMERHEMSMQNIRKWARNNPQEVGALLNQNPSYVFFRELDSDIKSPPGALGVPLTPGRSLAVDRRYIPLGAPVFVETSWPNSDQPLQRLMMAQDTGGAIKGRIRGDFFWGMGDAAGEKAGRMKQAAKFWVLLPKTTEEQK